MLAEDSFCKDGRKISVGDCALFQAGDSPPFIGLIRWLASGKEDYLKLGVNWLYRPADIKLGKGILLEAAPNEVFYSFHKDEIPAASLLHPCKVSFLRKGVELPSGISSFICRRVYDIANKCLWWLTDQDYINDRQEEVDLLLDKTHIEMHAAVQSGGRSPKPLNGPTSAQQLKSGSDSVQNSTVSCPPQVKGKKRERGEQGHEPIKRERSLKTDDGDSSHFKPEIMLKAEIAKITDNGGLINFEGVEKLVYLIQLDRAEKKIDLAGRIMISNVIAATDNIDCLSRFVQLRGVPVLDDWLQEVHKGKIGDSSSPKESDKSVEELLLALLHALDKLPVNLNALQTCNIGKSVNHLRSHKNMEIHKKARSLVDMWKKGVEAEMKINDAKSGSNQTVSWPGKPGFSDISHGVSKRAGSSEVTLKSSVAQPSAAKMAPIKLSHGDSVAKSTLGSPGSIKFSSKAVSVGTSEVPLTAIKEEKSSSSSQSQNNSQTYSSDHANKTSSGVSRHRKSSNGFSGSGVSGVQKENSSGKSGSSTRINPASDKVSQSGLTSERAVEIPVPDHGNSHRLIVRLPNPVRSPARSASGDSSPVVSEKHDHSDRKMKGKSDTYRSNFAADVNTESWQSNYGKDGLMGSDEGDRSPAAVIDEERSKNNDEGNGKELLTETKLRKLCEASASLSGRDDIGMNLLATVAAGEISKSDPVSPTGSPLRNSPLTGDKLILSQEDIAHGNIQDDCADDDFEKQGNNSAHSFGVSNGFPQATTSVSGNRKYILPFSEHVSASKQIEHLPASDRDLPQTAEPCLKADGKPDEVTLAEKREESSEGEVTDQFTKKGKKTISSEKVDGCVTNLKSKPRSLSSDEVKTVDSARENITENGVMPASNVGHGHLGDECDIEDAAALLSKIDKEALEESPSCPSLTVNNENTSIVPNGPECDVSTKQQPLVAPNPVDGSEDAVAHSSSTNVSCPNNVDESKNENEPVDPKTEQTSLVPPVLGDGVGTTGSLVLEHKNSGVKEELGRVEKISNRSELKDSPTFPAQEGEQSLKSTVSNLSGIEVDEMEEECACTLEASSLATTATGSDMTAKLDFDLNEVLGFPVDEGNQVGCSSAVHLPNPVPSITVASPAIGPFVPPENLLRSKGEVGWKGSAATSAFRPAEPRKNLDMPLTTSDIPCSDTTAAKQSRLTLDIDLNVADERVIEDVANNNHDHDLGHIGIFGSPAARPVLDLNQADESMDNGQFLASSSRRLELPLLPNSEANVLRDFDLNNGPNLDETGPESSLRNQHAKNSNLHLLTSVNGVRMNNTELVGGLSTWFPPGNPYPVVANPGAQRMVGSGASGSNFIGDLYRGGPVLSSSPAIAFPYAGFPFGTSFPLSTTTAFMDSSSGMGPLYQPVASQLVGPASGVSAHYSRPYVINLPEGSSSSGGVESSRKWARPGLDLNAGPGTLDMEGRDDRLKRKEPEGGWDLERFYRQTSWQ